MDATEMLTWDEDSIASLSATVVAAKLCKRIDYLDDGDTVWEFTPRIQVGGKSGFQSIAVELYLLDQYGAPVEVTIETLRHAPTSRNLLSARILVFAGEHEEGTIMKAFARLRPAPPHPDEEALDLPVRADTQAFEALGQSFEVVRASCSSAADYTGRAAVTVALRMLAGADRDCAAVVRAIDAEGLLIEGSSLHIDLDRDPSHPTARIATATLVMDDVPARVIVTPPHFRQLRLKRLPDIPDEEFELDLTNL